MGPERGAGQERGGASQERGAGINRGAGQEYKSKKRKSRREGGGDPVSSALAVIKDLDSSSTDS